MGSLSQEEEGTWLPEIKIMEYTGKVRRKKQGQRPFQIKN